MYRLAGLLRVVKWAARRFARSALMGSCATGALLQSGGPETIDGTSDGEAVELQDVRVDLGRSDVFVSQQLLHRADVGAIGQ